MDTFGGLPTITDSCSQSDLTGFSATNLTLLADPIIRAAIGEVFVAQAGGCVDQGSVAAADDPAFGFLALGLVDWTTLTTDLDAALDAFTGGANDVGSGFHHDPVREWIKTLVADGAKSLGRPMGLWHAKFPTIWTQR